MGSAYRTDIQRKVRQQRILHDVSLELTYACNLDCFFCYNDREKQGQLLSLEQYRQLLSDLARLQTLHLMLTGGEPMVHPYFYEIGAMTRELGFVTRIRSNGHNLNEGRAKRLRDEVDPYAVDVSLHGATAEVHDRQTRVRGSFQRLVKNLKSAKALGLRCQAVCTPTAWNQHQVDEMFELCDSLDIPLRFQGPVAPRDNGDTAPMAIQPDRSTWDAIAAAHLRRRQPEIIASSGQPTEIETRKAPCEETGTCGVGLGGVDIDPYGNVKACMHLEENAGNLHQQSIDEIWQHSPLFLRARDRAVAAARQFTDKRPEQYGAPLYCLAVEENVEKGHSACGGGCQ